MTLGFTSMQGLARHTMQRDEPQSFSPGSIPHLGSQPFRIDIALPVHLNGLRGVGKKGTWCQRST